MTLRSLPVHAVVPPPPAIGQRIARLQAEARGLAAEHVGALTQTLSDAATLSDEIASGGDAYPAGVRDIARRLAEELVTKAQTLAALMERKP